MDDRSQPPPLPDAPNAGDPTPRTLRLGDLIIEGVERVSEEEELSDHAIVFYNELITLMNAAGPSWQLIRKERYDKIKDSLSCCGLSAAWYADHHAIPRPTVEWKGLTVRWKRNWVHGWPRRVITIGQLVVA
jgi:hypothetical protein